MGLLPQIAWASDAEAFMAEMQATADGLQSLVSSRPMPESIDVAAWADFYNELSRFDATPVYDLWRPWLPSPHFIAGGSLTEAISAQAAALEGWRVAITQAAGAVVPSAGDPAADALSGPSAQTSSLLSTGAIAAAVVAAAAAAVWVTAEVFGLPSWKRARA